MTTFASLSLVKTNNQMINYETSFFKDDIQGCFESYWTVLYHFLTNK